MTGDKSYVIYTVRSKSAGIFTKITPNCLYKLLPFSTHATRHQRWRFKRRVQMFLLREIQTRKIIVELQVAKVTLQTGNIVESPRYLSL